MPSPAACCVAVLALAALASAHLSHLPGPFRNTHLQYDPLYADGHCDTVFKLDGHAYNVSALQIDVGGYIANNNVDKMAYCINVCRIVTSERNCVCNPCGSNIYPATQIDDLSTGETCQAYLGMLNHTSWELIDASNPRGGLALTYGDGQGTRSTRIEMYCNHQSGIDGPTFVGETADSVFVFQWNSTHACPVSAADTEPQLL